jgi:hypothetical protein
MIIRRRRAGAALVTAAVGIAAAVATAAGAQIGSGVRIAETPVSRFPDMAFSVSLPSNRPLTAKQLAVTENGKRVLDVRVE